MRKFFTPLLCLVLVLGCCTVGHAAVSKYEDIFLSRKAGSRIAEILPAASVYAYTPGCTASAAGSGMTVTVYACSNIIATDTIEIAGQTATVTSVDSPTSIVLDADLVWAKGDRMLNTTTEAALYEDPAGAVAITQPATTGSDGRIIFYVDPAVNPTFDVKGVLASQLVVRADVTVLTSLTPYFDILSTDYGAACDGVADDRAAIQSAIDDAAAAGGGEVRVPPGRTCIVDKVDATTHTYGLNLKTGVCVVGYGPSSVLKLKAQDNAAYWTRMFVTNEAASGVCVKNLKIDMNKTGHTGDTNQRNAFHVGNTAALTNFEVSGVTIDDVDGVGIYLRLTGGVTNGKILNNTITNCDLQCINYQGLAHGVISGNYVEACSTGIKSEDPSNLHDVAITGNTIRDMTGPGIQLAGDNDPLYYARNLSATANTITDCGDSGILLNYTRGAVVSGNTIRNCTNAGIEVLNDNQGAVLDGNTISGTIGPGSTTADILVRQASSRVQNSVISITDNVLIGDGTVAQAILADTQDGTGDTAAMYDLKIDGNTIDDTADGYGTYLIRVLATNEVTVSNNKLRQDGSKYYFYIDGNASYTPSDITVTDNQFIDLDGGTPTFPAIASITPISNWVITGNKFPDGKDQINSAGNYIGDVQYYGNSGGDEVAVGTFSIPNYIKRAALTTDNTATMQIESATEEVTLASGTTVDSTATLIPSNSLIFAVSYIVTTAIETTGGLTGYSTGDDSPDVNRFFVNDTSVGLAHQKVAGSAVWLAGDAWNASNAKIRFTALGGTFDGGAIRVTVYYAQMTAPAD